MKPVIIVMALLNFLASNNFQAIPALAVSTGPLISTIIILVIGFIAFYSCHLYLQHLGNHSDIDQAIKYHFWDSKIAKALYNLILFIFFFVYLCAYYSMLIINWQLLVQNQSILIPILNAIGLTLLVCVLKYFDWALISFACGTIVNFISCFMLIQVLISAPPGNNKPPLVGTGLGFECQQIFVPILRRLDKNYSKKFKEFTLICYIITTVIYLYFAYIGCFGLLNREPIYSPSLTIFAYFNPTQWQVKIYASLSILIIYFSFGGYAINAKKRFFALLNSFLVIKNTNQREFFTIFQLVFIILLMGLFLGLQLGNVKPFSYFNPVSVLLTFIYFYLVPVALQSKCIYFARPKPVYNIVFKKTDQQKIAQKNKQNQLLTMKPLFSRNSAYDQQTQQTDFEYESKFKASILQQRKFEIISITQSKTQSKVQNLNTDIIHSKQDQNKQQLLHSVMNQSFANQEKKKIKIQTLNQTCPAQLPTGMWKVLDLCSLFGMIGIGLYVTIQNLIDSQL